MNLTSDVIFTVKSDLGVTYIDNLLISFPSETSNECIQDVWLEVENCITDGSVLQGGVADMDKNELQVLYEWARVSVIVC